MRLGVRWKLFAVWVGLCACRQNAPTEPPRTAPPTPVTATDTQPEPAQGPAVVLHPEGHPPVRVRVEVARTPRVRERGLMFRREMADDAGMIFVFPVSEHQAFWMHNTYIPLDMMFIRSDRTVLGIVENATPETDTVREVPGDSQYVLEVVGGFSRRHHITAGTRVEFVNIPAATE